MIRCYHDLIQLQTIEERFEYLRMQSKIGVETFGFDRWMNQELYNSQEWRRVRREVTIRDNGMDMGLDGYPIGGQIIVHHMNPVTEEDLVRHDPKVFNPEYLISVSNRTHNAIHYGDGSLLPSPVIERKPFDTCPWRLS